VAAVVEHPAGVPGGEPVGEDPLEVLADLRRARRRRRIATFDVGEAVYRAYITFILTGIGVWLASGVVGDTRLHGHVVTSVARNAGWVAGGVIAAGWAVGVRSGGRGGPLALEAADVRHVLLSPVGRAVALRRPALRQLRFGAAIGAGGGAVAGLLAWRRLPGSVVEWIACGVLVGATAVPAGLGLAMVTSGRRVGRLPAAALAVLIAGWSAGDAAAGVTTSPATFLGQVAVWPLQFRAQALVGVAVALAAAVAGPALVAGLSIEKAESRASLVGQIRFAATLRDLRTVVVLRRQLSQEQPRQRPWFRLPRSVSVTPGASGSRSGTAGRRHLPVWRRGLHGIARFPGVRFARMALLGAAAGAAGVGAWAGTSPLILVVGACLYVAALDAVEPLAQELDHPDRRESYPVDEATLVLRLLAPSAALMVVVVAIAVAAAAVCAAVTGGGAALAAEIGGVAAVPAALAGLGGATISVVQGAPATFSATDSMLPPEAAGLRALGRVAIPPALAVLAGLPLLAAHHPRPPSGPVTAAASLTPGVLLGALAVGLWIRYRDGVRTWFAAAMQEAGAARRNDATADGPGGGQGGTSGSRGASGSGPGAGR
jgi:hypothetical protein